VILKYQQNFVKKLLSVSLKYGNVLYCIDNETSGVEEWATYWAGFIKDNSGGREIFITQMWDNWDVKSATHKRTLDHPERYGFIDISQNSQTTGQPNWDIDPRMDLLGGAGEKNAFLSAREGESYVIYFTGPTTVTLDLRAYDIPIIIDWIEIEKADWVKSASIAGGRIVELSSEYPGGAFAVLTLQKKRK